MRHLALLLALVLLSAASCDGNDTVRDDISDALWFRAITLQDAPEGVRALDADEAIDRSDAVFAYARNEEPRAYLVSVSYRAPVPSDPAGRIAEGCGASFDDRLMWLVLYEDADIGLSEPAPVEGRELPNRKPVDLGVFVDASDGALLGTFTLDAADDLRYTWDVAEPPC